jgi:hypothetical protein
MVRDDHEPVATPALSAVEELDALWKPDRDPEARWYPEDSPADALYVAR